MIYHIGISGGKDSTALLLWAIHESGIPHEQLRVTFSDTQNEHDWTYWYVRFLSRYTRRVTGGRVKVEWLKPELGFYELARKKKRFPSQVARFCTEHLKLIPTAEHIAKLRDGEQVVAPGYTEASGKVVYLRTVGHEVIAMSGVRGGENRDVTRYEHEPACSGIFGVPAWNALFKWTLEDVWAIHRRYGIPRNPLYVPTQAVRGFEMVKGYACIRSVLGIRPYRSAAGRVGCYPCVNSRKPEVANVARNFPDRIDMIRVQERDFPTATGFSGFFHQKAVPKRFHSMVIELKPLKGKKVKYSKDSLFAGEVGTVTAKPEVAVTVPTIDDVVKWALSDGDENECFDFEQEATAARLSCARSGACE